MSTPQAIPVNGDGTFDEPTWGESGTFSDSAYEASGMPASTLVGPNDFNAPRRHFGRWLRAIRDRQVPSDHGLFTDCMLLSGAWNTGGGTLNGTLGVSRLIVDANDDGGVLVEVRVSAGSPHVFTALRDTYVNVNESGALEYQAVANGAGAPSPSAGYVAVWKVVTDGTELTTATVLIYTIPSFRAIGALSLTAIGNVDVGGTLGVTGAATLASTLDVTGDTQIDGTLDVAGVTEIDDTFRVLNQNQSTLSGNTIIGTASGGDFLTCHAAGQFNENVILAKNLTVEGNTTIGTDAADTCTVNASTTFATAVVGPLSSIATGAGLSAFVATSATGYGMFINVDTTSPAKAAIYMSPQNADPSSPAGSGGDLMMNSTRNKLRFTNTSGVWQSAHSSPKGRVKAWSAAASGVTAGGSGNIAVTTAISPEEVGDVLVMATGSLAFDSDAGSCTLAIVDVTSGVTIASQTERAIDTDGVAPNARSVTIRGVRTLPSTAARTFAVVITASTGSITWSNLITSVEGVV